MLPHRFATAPFGGPTALALRGEVFVYDSSEKSLRGRGATNPCQRGGHPLLQSGEIHFAGKVAGHRASIFSVAVSSVSGRIAAGASDGRIIVWDENGRKLGDPIFAHHDVVSSLAWYDDDDDSVLVSASLDSCVKFWDSKTLLQRLPRARDHQQQQQRKTRTDNAGDRHQSDVNCCLVLQRRGLAVSGSDDETLRFWSLSIRNGTSALLNCVRTVKMRVGGGVRSMCVSRDEGLLAAGLSNGVVQLLDLSKGFGSPIVSELVPAGYNLPPVTAISFNNFFQPHAAAPDDENDEDAPQWELGAADAAGNLRLWRITRDFIPLNDADEDNKSLLRTATSPEQLGGDSQMLRFFEFMSSSMLLTASADGKIQVFDRTMELVTESIARYSGIAGQIHCAATTLGSGLEKSNADSSNINNSRGCAGSRLILCGSDEKSLIAFVIAPGVRVGRPLALNCPGFEDRDFCTALDIASDGSVHIVTSAGRVVSRSAAQMLEEMKEDARAEVEAAAAAEENGDGDGGPEAAAAAVAAKNNEDDDRVTCLSCAALRGELRKERERRKAAERALMAEEHASAKKVRDLEAKLAVAVAEATACKVMMGN